MSVIKRMATNLRDVQYLRNAKRAFDDRPIHCNMYVTDKCNLDCHYCHEYDNTQPHPSFEDLRARITHARDLGITKISLVGGEPLMHPDIVALVAHSAQLGVTPSLSTNGYLLKSKMIKDLESAGLKALQISVDRKTLSSVSRKALDKVADKILEATQSSIKVHITTVLCKDTVAEARQVLDFGLRHNILTELRVMHDNPDKKFQTERASQEDLRNLLIEQIRLKRMGKKIHATNAILNFQKSMLGMGDYSWTCLAGFKIFFVSARGEFWLCSHVKTAKPFLEVTLSDLKRYKEPKSCQDRCGIFCAVNNSSFATNPLRFVTGEIAPRVKQSLALVRAEAGARL